jgi:hypothetical protein
MSRTNHKTEQEVIDAINAMREFPRYAERTGETAKNLVEGVYRAVSEQYPGGWSWNTVARVAKYMVRKNETAGRAILAVG